MTNSTWEWICVLFSVYGVVVTFQTPTLKTAVRFCVGAHEPYKLDVVSGQYVEYEEKRDNYSYRLVVNIQVVYRLICLCKDKLFVRVRDTHYKKDY